MTCTIKNPANYDLSSLEPHIHGMYDHFSSKYGFKRPPTMIFDSDPSNQPSVLGKTAYYDPQSLEIHVFIDGRHPKDVLRSIAHELIHHRQNLEGRLESDGYSGPGYYLENDNLKEVEHEAMLDGNATMREYEDTVKYKEKDKMSLKEWKNNELNKLLLKKFGILKETQKPDEDGDGVPDWADKKEGDDNEKESLEEGELPDGLKKYQNNKQDKDNVEEGGAAARTGNEGHDVGKGRMTPDRIHEEDEELEEGRNNPRTTNSDKFVGNEDRYRADRIHENEDEMENDTGAPEEKINSLQEAMKRIANAKKVFLNGKRIK